MASTYSPSLRIELIGAGEQSGTWNTTTNSNLGTLIEQAISGVTSITMTDANYTLTAYNGVSDQSRQAVIIASGTNAAIRDIVAPLVTKTYLIKNNTSGGFDIRVRAATGASVSIPNGVTSIVYCDGTNFNLGIAQTSVAAGTGVSISVVGATTTVNNTGVLSFNTRTGAVTLTSADVTTALGYTPPTPTGTGASGTWGINVTGSANSANTASNLNGTWAQMPAGTVTNFFQAAAPTGWVQRTDLNDFMLYIVSGAGGYGAGTHSPTVMNVVPYHTHGFTTGGQNANHTHYDSGHTHGGGNNGGINNGLFTWAGCINNAGYDSSRQNTMLTGYANIGYTSNDHSHSGGTDGGSSQTNWAPRYLANIMCYKS